MPFARLTVRRFSQQQASNQQPDLNYPEAAARSLAVSAHRAGFSDEFSFESSFTRNFPSHFAFYYASSYFILLSRFPNHFLFFWFYLFRFFVFPTTNFPSFLPVLCLSFCASLVLVGRMYYTQFVFNLLKLVFRRNSKSNYVCVSCVACDNN